MTSPPERCMTRRMTWSPTLTSRNEIRRTAGFLIDLRRLPAEHRKLFVAAVHQLLRPALDAGAHRGVSQWPRALRIHRIGTDYSMTGASPHQTGAHCSGSRMSTGNRRRVASHRGPFHLSVIQRLFCSCPIAMCASAGGTCSADGWRTAIAAIAAQKPHYPFESAQDGAIRRQRRAQRERRAGLSAHPHRQLDIGSERH